MTSFMNENVSIDQFLIMTMQEVSEFSDESVYPAKLEAWLEEISSLSRKDFCEFLDVGESTLSGWLKEDRIPRPVKLVYFLLYVSELLKDEVRRLRCEASDEKLIQCGQEYQIVQFKTDGDGTAIGKIIAQNIPTKQLGLKLAGSTKAFRLLDDARDVVEDMYSRVDHPVYEDMLQKLLQNIDREARIACAPDTLAREKEDTHSSSCEIDIGDTVKVESEAKSVDVSIGTDQASKPASKRGK